MSTVYPDPGRKISTGRAEIDHKIGGGIPAGSLTLIEGPQANGNRLVCQHLTYNALQAGFGVVYYSSQNTSPSLISQMESLGLDVLDYFLLDKLRIYPLQLTDRYPGPVQLLPVLLRHFAALPQEFNAIILDSLTSLLAGPVPLDRLKAGSSTGVGQARSQAEGPVLSGVEGCNNEALVGFFYQCKQLCRQGKTMILVADARTDDPAASVGSGFNPAHGELRPQVDPDVSGDKVGPDGPSLASARGGYSLFDIHLRLRMKAVMLERVVEHLEVFKARGTRRHG